MLAKIFSVVGIPILDWLFEKISKGLSRWIRKRREIDKREKKNEEVRKATKAAKTAREKEAALRSKLRNF